MAEGKKSFLLYCDILYTIEKLSDEQTGILFKHILKYVNDENPILDNFVLELVFEPIKQSLKRDLKKYENICERNKINGSKGGRPKKPKKPSRLIGNPNNPSKPKKPDSDIDSDIDKKIDIKNILINNQKNFEKEVLSFKNEYDHNLLKAFYAYWSEGDEKGRMRKDFQKTWETKRRLVTWKNINRNFTK
jgi:hypothetical protein